MRTVYATQFRFKLHENQTPQVAFEDIQGLIFQWIRIKYLRTWKKDLTLNFDDVTISPLPGHKLLLKHQKLNDIELLTLEWVHPHDYDLDTAWHSTLQLALNGNTLELAYLLRAITVHMTLKPVRFKLGRPNIITTLLSKYEVTINEWPIPTSVQILKPGEVEQFVASILQNPDRRLPVVLVTPESLTGISLVDYDDLFKMLKGFAHVVYLDSKWASFKLTELIGRELSCFNGAVRLYWPGFLLTANPFHHHLYLPDDITYYSTHGSPLGEHLFKLIASVSAFRFTEGPVIRATRKVFIDADRERVNQLAEQVKLGRATEAEIEKEWSKSMEQIDQLEKENQRLESEIQKLESDNEDLKVDLENQKNSWAEYKSLKTTEGIDPTCLTTELPNPKKPLFESVRDAYMKAKNDFSDVFVFLDSAEQSAEDSPYLDFDRVYEAFEALHLVSVQWRENNGTLGCSWVSALADLGFEYKDKISQTSKGKYRSDYMFVYKGKKEIFGQHITIGAKTPDTCLSVHFLRDEDERKLVIGHCGRHLTNTKS